MGSKLQKRPDRRARIERELRERELAAMVQRQHGVIARRQLKALGIGDGAIKARLRMGSCTPSIAASTHSATGA